MCCLFAGTPSSAFTPLPPSALAPTQLSARAPLPKARGPESRLLTWASTWPRRHQWQNRASRLPRPSVPRPLEGKRDSGLARVPRRCAGCACFAACCVCACARSGGWGGCRRNAVEAAEATSSRGRRGCRGRPRWGKGRFPGEGRKWVSPAAHTALSGEVRKNGSRFSHFMVKSLEPPQTPSRQEHQQLLRSSCTWSSNDHLLSTAGGQVCDLPGGIAGS